LVPQRTTQFLARHELTDEPDHALVTVNPIAVGHHEDLTSVFTTCHDSANRRRFRGRSPNAT